MDFLALALVFAYTVWKLLTWDLRHPIRATRYAAPWKRRQP